MPVSLQVKLVDAAFIWTEPHSRRLKTKLTVQKEVMNGAILQQTFQVEYVVEPHMCLDCNRANANPNTWTACVQVRSPATCQPPCPLVGRPAIPLAPMDLGGNACQISSTRRLLLSLSTSTQHM